jgi:hypothetical protein
MLRKVMAIVLLTFLGLIAGFVFGLLFPSYEVGDALLLPAHSPHSAWDLVRMTRDVHPGVRVVAYGARHVSFSATGSLARADRAVNLANKEVIAANDGKVKSMFYGLAAPFSPVGDGLKGFLAGLGAALGFLLPPRSRLRATG